MFYDAFTGWCRAKGVSAAQAAEGIGIHPKSVDSWKTRVPVKSALPRIEAYFGIGMETVCDAAREHLLQRPGYTPQILTGETADNTGRVLTRVQMEFFPELPMPWAMRTKAVEHLISDEERAEHKARVMAAAAPEAIPILRKIYGETE